MRPDGSGVGASDDVSVNVLALGPKVGLVPDELALNLPIGFAWAEFLRQGAHPPPRPGRDLDDLVVLNLGLGVGPDPDRWLIRPEFGILLNPGEEGRFQHFSVGVSFYTGR